MFIDESEDKEYTDFNELGYRNPKKKRTSHKRHKRHQSFSRRSKRKRSKSKRRQSRSKKSKRSISNNGENLVVQSYALSPNKCSTNVSIQSQSQKHDFDQVVIVNPINVHQQFESPVATRLDEMFDQSKMIKQLFTMKKNLTVTLGPNGTLEEEEEMNSMTKNQCLEPNDKFDLVDITNGTNSIAKMASMLTSKGHVELGCLLDQMTIRINKKHLKKHFESATNLHTTKSINPNMNDENVRLLKVLQRMRKSRRRKLREKKSLC